MSTKSLGNLGEDLAEKYLKNKGYKILERNWKTPLTGSGQIRQKEIDIIARKRGAIIFVEVKTLLQDTANPNRFLAEESIGPQKRKNLILASKFYLIAKKIPQDTPWQIDVIAVEIYDKINKPLPNFSKKNLGGQAKIHHFENEIY